MSPESTGRGLTPGQEPFAKPEYVTEGLTTSLFSDAISSLVHLNEIWTKFFPIYGVTGRELSREEETAPVPAELPFGADPWHVRSSQQPQGASRMPSCLLIHKTTTLAAGQNHRCTLGMCMTKSKMLTDAATSLTQR